MESKFVRRSCQVKGLHADSKGVGFRKSPLLQKLTIWYKGKEVTENETYAISGRSVILPSQGIPPMLQPDRPNHEYIIKELMSLRATVEVNNLFSLQRHKH
jgi:hypothetical protein